MNERIKELAEQAGYTPLPGFDFANDIQELFIKKFAELIVRECIDIVKPTQHHEAWAQSYLGGVDGLELLDSRVEKIKQHFGVDEPEDSTCPDCGADGGTQCGSINCRY